VLEQGTTTGVDLVPHADSCADVKIVTEWYCSGGDALSADLSCGSGTCSKGQCISSVQAKATFSPLEIISDWRVLSLVATMIMVVLVALAYMFGIGIESPELKAWGATELTQVFVTAIIIVSFTAVITLVDNLTVSIVQGSNLPFTCKDVDNCAVKVATEYLNGMIKAAEGQAKERLIDSANAAQTASLHGGGYATTILSPPLLQASIQGSLTAGYIMDVERNNVLLEHLGNLLAVMYAQKFFVEQISRNIGPLILVLGIVARSFFLTRKLGGLLIAISIAVLYVLPLMYVANWITLNVTLFGSSIITPAAGPCPEICKTPAPELYSASSGNTPIYSKSYPPSYPTDIYTFLGWSEDTMSPSDKQQLSQLENGEIASLPSPVNGNIAISCEYAALNGPAADTSNNPDDFGITASKAYCPYECRELPYPLAQPCTGEVELGPLSSSAGFPATSFNQTAYNTKRACSALPAACKIIRYVNPSDPYNIAADTNDPLNSPKPACPQDCRTIPPLKSNCDKTVTVTAQIAKGGTGSNPVSLTADCLASKDYCLFSYSSVYLTRPDGCHVSATPYTSKDEAQREANPEACVESSTASESCVYVLPFNPTAVNDGHCNSCLFVKPEYTFYPAVYANCGAVCGSQGAGPPKINPAEFAQRTAEGMIGRPEIKSTAALVLPAYILPLLDILITLMFIRTFSPMLGGDIEIPGLAKII
jgi:hypothetical protein